ncbi:hypothetical protein BU17DRAFT_75416 [Hysterangium stoloniferum]|nr:hypothetical protein BU17DRAFT_75416 [Hysterangium stoloniferum]
MSLEPNDIPSEAPPAYTPIADPYQGEAPLDFGPRRPFQEPPVLTQPNIAPNIPAININDTGNSTTDRRPQPSRFDFEPPPRHPSVASPSPASANSSHDFHVPPSDYLRPSSETAYSPTSPAQVRSNTPPLEPPGPPRRRAVSFSNRPSGLMTENNSISDDNRPTTTPTPGHPLLRGGKLLVYPNGFECSKCHNTGFKKNDPSHPCSKCWDKYAKPYYGALAYAPFPSAGSSNGNFQRPLPVFRPPQAPRPRSMEGSPGKLHRVQSRPQPPPQSQSHQPHMPPQTPQLYSPPPHGPPHSPQGDPRIGGRLCWRCDGRGKVTFFIFDSTFCEVCRGVGRVFN